MNDDDRCADHERRRRRPTVPTPAPPERLQPPPLGDPQDAGQSGLSGNDYGGFVGGPLAGDMYVVPFGLENGVTVGMPGYVPMDPVPTLFQTLPSISAMQTGKFYPQTTGADVKDDRLFQLMTSSSSLPVPPSVGDGYSQQYETNEQLHQQDMGGYGVI